MQTGTVFNLNTALAFGFPRAIKVHYENLFQQRRFLCQHSLFVNPNKVLISKSESQLGEASKQLVYNPSWQVPGYKRNSCLYRSMSASGSNAPAGDLIVDNMLSSCGSVPNKVQSTGVYYRDRHLRSLQKANASMRNCEQRSNQLVHGYFIYNITHRQLNCNSTGGSLLKSFCTSAKHTSSSSPYVDGAVPDVAYDQQLASLAIETDGKGLAGRTLKLISGSCYLPHPDKAKTGGEDAHFICEAEQVIGVADGVGGWAEVGVDAGEYSRALMSNSVRAIQNEPKDCIDPARVLTKAHSVTKAQGSSTACIIALKNQDIHAINLGDSGFIVVRDGLAIFQSPVQQHGFNFTYQLDNGSSGGDLPSSGQVFNIPVDSGDIIVAGTDGLFDNLYTNEITAVVVDGVRAGLNPEETAQKIAALARQKALDRKWKSPFAKAAEDAGYRYYGGKLDDVTVVVSFIQ